MKYDLLLLDSPYLSHRSFSLQNRLTTSTGLDATLIHNFIRSLGPLKRKFPFAEMIFAWESYGTTSWRRELYQSYKPPKFVNDGYKEQVRDLQRLLSNLGYKLFYSNHNEADDTIASLCDIHNKDNKVIFTVDKDIMQLVNENTHVYTGNELFTERDVFEKFGVYPLQIPDLLAIWGDTADNIEGIPGFGFKKSVEIIEKYQRIESILENHPLQKVMEKLILNKRLTTLNRSCRVVNYIPYPKCDTFDIIRRYELKQIGEHIEDYRSEHNENKQTQSFIKF